MPLTSTLTLYPSLILHLSPHDRHIREQQGVLRLPHANPRLRLASTLCPRAHGRKRHKTQGISRHDMDKLNFSFTGSQQQLKIYFLSVMTEAVFWQHLPMYTHCRELRRATMQACLRRLNACTSVEACPIAHSFDSFSLYIPHRFERLASSCVRLASSFLSAARWHCLQPLPQRLWYFGGMRSVITAALTS